MDSLVYLPTKTFSFNEDVPFLCPQKTIAPNRHSRRGQLAPYQSFDGAYSYHSTIRVLALITTVAINNSGKKYIFFIFVLC